MRKKGLGSLRTMSTETHTGLIPIILRRDRFFLNHGSNADIKTTQVPQTDSNTDYVTLWLPEVPWIPSIRDYLDYLASLSHSSDEECDAKVARILAKEIAKEQKFQSRLAKKKKSNRNKRQCDFPSTKINNGASGALKTAQMAPVDSLVNCAINPSKKTHDNANAFGASVNVDKNVKGDGSKFKDVWEDINALVELMFEEPTISVGQTALETIPTYEKKKTGLFQKMFTFSSFTAGHGNGRHGNGNIKKNEEHAKNGKKKQSIFRRIRKVFSGGKKTV